jgi:hypothetical protein
MPSPKIHPPQARRSRKVEDGSDFTITLIWEGNRHLHEVWEDKPVDELIHEAADIFGLYPTTIILMLFSLYPRGH